MLRNPSFESGHYPIAIGNCPNEWALHWLDGETPDGFDLPARAPECQVPSKLDIPEYEWAQYFLDGDHCVKVFKPHAPIWWAMSQTVTGLTPGAVYRLTMPVYLDVFDWDGRKVYPDDGYAAEARAGIGNTWDSVAWADWQAPAHGTLEFGVYGDVVLEFTAASSVETVWLECKAKWALDNNGFFLDAFRLECVEEPEPEPPGREYERTYVLLPQDATRDEVVEQLTEHYDDKRTIGYSADDALVDPAEVTERTVLIPYDRFPGNILDFADTYYPGATIYLEGEKVRPLDEPPTPPTRLTRGHYGPHIQGLVTPALDYIRRVQPPVVKIFGLGDVFDILSASPHTNVVFRYWLGAYDQELLRTNPDKSAAARAYVDRFRGALYDVAGRLRPLYPDKSPLFYVESINEEYECNHPKNFDTAAFDVAFIREIAGLGLDLRASVFTAAQGNPEVNPPTPDLDIVLQVGEVAAEYGALMAYHNYWGANIDLPPCALLEAGWPWSPGRWQIFDDYLTAHGVHVTWFGGESGPCTSSDGVHLDAGGGWRAPDCHAGNVARLVAEVMLHEDKVVEWNASHDDRFLGSVGFTDGSDWDTFLYGSAWYAIGDAMMQRYP